MNLHYPALPFTPDFPLFAESLVPQLVKTVLRPKPKTLPTASQLAMRMHWRCVSWRLGTCLQLLCEPCPTLETSHAYTVVKMTVHYLPRHFVWDVSPPGIEPAQYQNSHSPQSQDPDGWCMNQPPSHAFVRLKSLASRSMAAGKRAGQPCLNYVDKA